jgi:hypothetical protein
LTTERKSKWTFPSGSRGPVFRALRDSKFFKKFFIEAGTLAWPNGVDIAPEALYQAEDVRSVGEKNRKRINKPHR